MGHADTRQQAAAFWSLATYLLNGALFVLIGLEVQQRSVTRGLVAVGVVSAVLVSVRSPGCSPRST